MTMTALVQYTGSCVVDDSITGIYVKQTVVLTPVRRRYQFVRPGTHQYQHLAEFRHAAYNTIINGYIQLQCSKTQALNEQPVLTTYLSTSSSHVWY